MIAASSPPSVVRDGCNRRPSTPRSSARSVCVAGKVRASVASWVARASVAARVGTRGLLVGGALLDERHRAGDESHDQQDREADRERPQPAGRSTRGTRLVIVRGVGSVEKLALERTCLTGMGCGPVERGFEARAAVQLGGIAPRGVPVDRRGRDAVVEPATVAVLFQPASQAGPLSQQRLVRDLGRAVARGDETPCDERLEHVRVSELDEGHPPADVVGVFCGLGESEQELPALALLVQCQLQVRVLGESRHRAAHTTGVVVAGVGEGAAAAAHPGLQECRRQQRERARLVRHVGGDRVGKPGFERQSGAVGGFLDRGVDLVIGHGSDEQVTLGEHRANSGYTAKRP